MNWHGTLLTSGSTVPKFYFLSTLPLLCPGFQVRGSAPKKIAPSGGRRENYWGISWEKSRFYAKKSYFSNLRGGARNFWGISCEKLRFYAKIIFLPILGGARRVRPPLTRVHSTHRKESTLTNTHRSQTVWHIHLEKCKKKSFNFHSHVRPNSRT